jgi:thioredoxin reductase
LWNANLVENYPGFPSGLPGPKLVRLFQRQADRRGVQIIDELVTQVLWEDGLFRLTASQGSYSARHLILAMGTKPHPFINLQIPPAFQDRVLYEVQSILHLRGKSIAIVGAGDAAFDYALNLSSKNQVVILNRSERRKCLALLEERVALSPNIRYYSSTSLIGIGSASSGELQLNCTSPTSNFSISANYLIGALGREPRLDCLPALFRQKASLLVQRKLLYFVGDIKNGMFRQTAIAVGDGLLAAMQIYQRVSNL